MNQELDELGAEYMGWKKSLSKQHKKQGQPIEHVGWVRDSDQYVPWFKPLSEGWSKCLNAQQTIIDKILRENPGTKYEIQQISGSALCEFLTHDIDEKYKRGYGKTLLQAQGKAIVAMLKYLKENK